MADFPDAVIQPVPDGNAGAYFAGSVDPFVAGRVYEIIPTKIAFTPSVVVDLTAPVISNISPPQGTILAATDPVSFDVTDDSGAFARILVAVKYTTGVQELIHDGDIFVGFYALQSSRVQIASGFRYTILRTGGWLTAPTFRAFPIDAAGNDGT